MDILSDIWAIVLPILATGITGFIAYVGTKLKALYETHINTEEKEKVISATVKYVEQLYSDLNSKDKLKQAIAVAKEWLVEKNITISDIELSVLIESAVNDLISYEVVEETEKIEEQ